MGAEPPLEFYHVDQWRIRCFCRTERERERETQKYLSPAPSLSHKMDKSFPFVEGGAGEASGVVLSHFASRRGEWETFPEGNMNGDRWDGIH